MEKLELKIKTGETKEEMMKKTEEFTKTAEAMTKTEYERNVIVLLTELVKRIVMIM